VLEVGFLYRLRNNTVEGAGVDYRLAGGCVFRKTFSQPLANLVLFLNYRLNPPLQFFFHSPAFVGLFYLSANHIKFIYLIKEIK